MDYNWLSPKAKAVAAGPKGMGSVAIEPIAAGETVVAFGGWMVPHAVLVSLPAERQQRSLQVDDDLYLVSSETPEDGDFVNHSCDPNCGLLGTSLVVALRDIAVGEEITFDYAMCDASDYDEFDCHCGSTNCRGVVRGTDWQIPELQEKYVGSFSPYLAKRIASSRDS